MDGFRWDYTSKTETPNFDRLVAEGTYAESLMPSFPSKTFPNHYTMATGLYPDNHGIVQNNFYDPDLDRSFRIGDRAAVEDPVFWGGEPIWETAEKQGVKSASFFWVGSEGNAEFLPSIRKDYDEDISFSTRIDSVISWLHFPEAIRPHLILFYFHEPDGVGHEFGPDSPETVDMIRRLDSLLGEFIDQLKEAENDLNIDVNFIVTSDHGMGGIPEDNYVILDQIINPDSLIRVHGGNPVYLLTPEEDYRDLAFKKLSEVEELKVWYKSDLPEHYHYGTNSRVEQIVVEPIREWGISMRERSRGYSAGTHGYDPMNKDMHGIFYAVGPAFKKGYTQSTFQNICIYPLIAEILELDPAETDGSLETIQSMLVSGK